MPVFFICRRSQSHSLGEPRRLTWERWTRPHRTTQDAKQYKPCIARRQAGGLCRRWAATNLECVSIMLDLHSSDAECTHSTLAQHTTRAFQLQCSQWCARGQTVAKAATGGRHARVSISTAHMMPHLALALKNVAMAVPQYTLGEVACNAANGHILVHEMCPRGYQYPKHRLHAPAPMRRIFRCWGCHQRADGAWPGGLHLPSTDRPRMPTHTRGMEATALPAWAAAPPSWCSTPARRWRVKRHVQRRQPCHQEAAGSAARTRATTAAPHLKSTPAICTCLGIWPLDDAVALEPRGLRGGPRRCQAGRGSTQAGCARQR